MTMHLRKGDIRDLALAHGFELCHFTRPAIDPVHARALDAWVAAGMHGDMGYMAEPLRTARRKAPEGMLQGVRTVICVGMRHTPPPYTLDQAGRVPERGVIAAYAHGHDYHDVMKRRLKALARELDERLGVHAQRVYVDTAPVLEHALAEGGGLGWQGKHTLTIHRRLGSWLMLGEIFTTLEIEPDAPASHHCGSCTACIDVCPTRAIVAPFVVDARRCISYLTIEFRGFIPRALRPLMGNRIFGCDDCQAVCPWNRHAHAPAPDLLAPRRENSLPDLRELLALDEQGFRSRFRASPVRRTGRAGLLRNVAVAMGNSGEAGFLPDLSRAMADDEPLVRGHAAWAVVRVCPQQRRGEIGERLGYHAAREPHAGVRQELDAAIKYMEAVEEPI
ncbi:MAG TPA: tRNA epoxyqueuosine(34) reductase QueG [Mariprofundaceae bacterium]|nr:tRNA epoxyqueuosine(34) reductase QueG [Mariprofundaceae bacterium]